MEMRVFTQADSRARSGRPLKSESERANQNIPRGSDFSEDVPSGGPERPKVHELAGGLLPQALRLGETRGSRDPGGGKLRPAKNPLR